MSEWYDRQGNLITTADMDTNRELWLEQMGEVEKMLRNYEYKVVKQTVGVLGQFKRKKVMISTVWLGLDHSFGSGSKPIIFETMVFDYPNRNLKTSSNYLDDYQTRYSTEEEALAHHDVLVSKYLVPGTTEVISAEKKEEEGGQVDKRKDRRES